MLGYILTFFLKLVLFIDQSSEISFSILKLKFWNFEIKFQFKITLKYLKRGQKPFLYNHTVREKGPLKFWKNLFFHRRFSCKARNFKIWFQHYSKI